MPQVTREMIDQETIQMVTNDRGWPIWPFLPLKNKKEKDGPFPLLGFICAPPSTTEITVYVGGMPIYERRSPSDFPTRRYPDLAAFLAAGWEVD